MSEEEFEALQFCESPFWLAYEEARRARQSEETLRRELEEMRRGK
jgi:hypothetical protein